MSFKCQRCRQSLRIDDSIANIDPSAADMLIGNNWKKKDLCSFIIVFILSD